jgi:hypothetical protein
LKYGITPMPHKLKTKSTFTYALILILTITQVAFINNMLVNGQVEKGTIPPDAFTKPSEITVFSPTNGTISENGTLTLSINVTLPQSSTASGTILYSVAYTSDWNNETVYLYINKGYSNSIESQIPFPGHQYFTGSIEVKNIPDGNHNITITAYAGGFYPADGFRVGDGLGFYRFLINGISTIFFIVGNPATETPIQTTYLPTDRNAPHLDPIYYLIPISVTVVIVILFLLIYRGLRKTASSVNSSFLFYKSKEWVEINKV